LKPSADVLDCIFLAALGERPLRTRERLLQHHNTETAQVDQLIAANALGWTEVKRLMTVPGVNVTVAAMFMAAVGDIRRFGDRRKLTTFSQAIVCPIRYSTVLPTPGCGGRGSIRGTN